ncbi:putative hydroxymethylpyrimidine transporter CytX [Treponema sp.]|uniref:putative hydroxymethylpyrimidine transporter CytX n=1 Tax=Treponema sp. TaxID=166 RepID=UPI0038902F52
MKTKNEIVQNSLVWFGAGVSIAEIITGTYFAPLGFAKGFLTILAGHIIGCALFFLCGLIGAKTRKTAMGTVENSFGKTGSKFFAILNVLQLVGWTAIMIYDGSMATAEIFSIKPFVWCIIIGALIFVWILCGVKDLGWINRAVMGLLFVLSLVLCAVILKNGKTQNAAVFESLSFGLALELSIAMPLSWLPLISDYTKNAENHVGVTLGSTLTYGITSVWMYVIGMVAAIFTGEGNIVAIMVKSGLGVVALVILIMSTVTTTFLDSWSAGISSESIAKKLNGKTVALIVTVVGTVAAILYPMDNITDFLYLIGSVFAPMAAIQIADFYILKRSSEEKKVDVINAIIWIIGFIVYRLLMRVDIIIGNTIPAILIVIALCVAVRKVSKK